MPGQRRGARRNKRKNAGDEINEVVEAELEIDEGSPALFQLALRHAIYSPVEEVRNNRAFEALNKALIPTSSIASNIKKDPHAVEIALNRMHALQVEAEGLEEAEGDTRRKQVAFLTATRESLARQVKDMNQEALINQPPRPLAYSAGGRRSSSGPRRRELA